MCLAKEILCLRLEFDGLVAVLPLRLPVSRASIFYSELHSSQINKLKTYFSLYRDLLRFWDVLFVSALAELAETNFTKPHTNTLADLCTKISPKM